MKEIINKTIDILCINGECYVNIIEEKKEEDRTWYEKFYLWYRQNFTTIILVLGCLLLISMIYYMYSNKHNKNTIKTTAIQTGGFNAHLNTQILPVDETVIPGGGKISGAIAKGTSKVRGATTKQISKGADKIQSKAGISGDQIKEKAGKAKEAIKAAPGKAKEAAKKKGKQAGKAIAKGVNKFAKSYYTILFSVGIVLGFAFFFLPTICMLVIGFLTYQITKNQIVSVLTA